MGSIKHPQDAGYFFRLPHPPVSGKRSIVTGEKTPFPIAKQNSDEAYLSSCRPTRLSMEMMSKLRTQGK